MTFHSRTWYPIAVGLGLLNLVAVAFAGAPWHATIHAALALGFGLWAQRLRQGPDGSRLQAGLESLEFEVSRLRQELTETQERVDFTERVLAQQLETRRIDPER